MVPSLTIESDHSGLKSFGSENSLPVRKNPESYEVQTHGEFNLLLVILMLSLLQISS
jgi:hypothetical protein